MTASFDWPHLLGPQGPLGQALPGFVARQAQVQMAQAVSQAITDQQVLIAEAGTGTGKTFAYLVPALLQGGKVVISTGTKTLQDQLFEKDLPTVRQALNVPVTVALLKGRANYICIHRMEQAAVDGRLASRDDVVHLQRIIGFARSTRTGDRAEVSTVPERATVWPLVTSTRDNCLGSECPQFSDCFVMRARRQAIAADVVVVNHHLFFADIALKEGGVAELLPAANTIVFDEAHQLADIARNFFGATVSTTQLLDMARESAARGLSLAREVGDWQVLAAQVERAARELRLVINPMVPRKYHGETGGTVKGNAALADPEFIRSLQDVCKALEQLQQALEIALPTDPEFGNLLERCMALHTGFDGWVKLATSKASEAQTNEPDAVRWIDVRSQSVALHTTPIDIAPVIQAQRAGRPQAWILSSATLSVGGDFTHLKRELGLPEAQSHTWPPVFDYARQALLYLPAHLPLPNTLQFNEEAAQEVWPLIQACNGGVFVLCTTLRAVQAFGRILQERLAQEDNQRPLLIQGSLPRNELLNRFAQQRGSILVGSASFWEGVDMAGDLLELVIIDKLPFAPPDDPLQEAIHQSIKRNGGDPFNEYQLPQAAIALKQGAGRLLRKETDRGVLVICDPRVARTGYGKKLLASLPPFAQTRQQEHAIAFLQGTAQSDASA